MLRAAQRGNKMTDKMFKRRVWEGEVNMHGWHGGGAKGGVGRGGAGGGVV